ncbi:YqaA family protein [Gemmatimonas sp.]|jgi:membrane protein YqaA with SNARE-associated domain|uniref:YqaA family protein n=1 Tax=Gemmatimonas sp. TaxID=1962908 RepID=UPI0037BFFF82
MATSPGLLHRTHARLQRWADAGWSSHVVFGWGLLQGVIFPGVADLFFLPLALARPARAYPLALIATAGTLLGSVVLYWVGAEALLLLEGPISRVVDLSPAALAEYRLRLAEWGGWAIFASTLSPLSTKLTSIASGAAGVPVSTFVSALLAGRLTRTMALAWMVRNGGAEMVAKWVARESKMVAPRNDGGGAPLP